MGRMGTLDDTELLNLQKHAGCRHEQAALPAVSLREPAEASTGGGKTGMILEEAYTCPPLCLEGRTRIGRDPARREGQSRSGLSPNKPRCSPGLPLHMRGDRR